MAFTNVGTVSTIAPGQTLYWQYWFTRREDRGAQVAVPDIKTRGAILVAFDQGKARPNPLLFEYYYTVRIRNIGRVACRHNLQGGGFGAVPFKSVGNAVTLAAGRTTFRNVKWSNLSSPPFGDMGAIYIGPNLLGQGQLVAFSQGKEILRGWQGGRAGVQYSVGIRNEGSYAASYNLQGGGILNGFNDVGELTSLAPGQTITYWLDYLGEDYGGQYVMADVKTIGARVDTLSLGKEVNLSGRVRYWATFRNTGSIAAIFNIQGGALN